MSYGKIQDGKFLDRARVARAQPVLASDGTTRGWLFRDASLLGADDARRSAFRVMPEEREGWKR